MSIYFSFQDKKECELPKIDEMKLDEYYIKDHYKTINESLALFQNDPLVHKPGTHEE